MVLLEDVLQDSVGRFRGGRWEREEDLPLFGEMNGRSHTVVVSSGVVAVHVCWLS